MMANIFPGSNTSPTPTLILALTLTLYRAKLHHKLHEFLDDLKQILHAKPNTQQVAPPNLTLESLQILTIYQRNSYQTS